jgi:excisionase family DNA binding protein
MENKQTLTVKGMAEALNIGIVTAYQLVNSENFYPAFRIGRKILVNRQRLQEWLDEQTGGKQ